MNIRVLSAAALAAVLLGTVHRAAPLTIYSAPAGNRPAGASPGHPTDAVLPNGRIAAPVGPAVFVGTNPLGVALSPDGRYAIVSNDDQRSDLATPDAASSIVAGYSLAVVDTRSMRVTDVYQRRGDDFYIGVAVLRDPKAPHQTIVLASDGASNVVRVFDLSPDGKLALEPAAIALKAGSFPGSIYLAPNGRTAYVVDTLGDSVTAIDVASRRVIGSMQAGYSPFDVVATKLHAYVTNGGLQHYHPLARPTAVPRFENITGNPDRQSSLSILPLLSNGGFGPADALGTVRLDPVPDGTTIVGGAHPGSIALRKDGRFAYAALSNDDRVVILGLDGEPHVLDGLDLRLFPDAPYGTEPSAVVLSPDAKRLYVALAGLDSIAVLDAHNPVVLHRLGLIPTGAYPTALALSKDGHFLYVVNTKGVSGWGTLERIDLRHLNLMKTTLTALRYQRTVKIAKPNPIVPPLRSLQRSHAIDRVVYISIGGSTFDAMFGDLKNADGTPHGNVDPALDVYPQSVTPNLHALALTYALADNFYADDSNRDANRQYALGGNATLYTERTRRVNDGREPLDAHAQDPDNYPRSGYVFNALARAGISFRDYGELVQLSGYDDGRSSQHARNQPGPGGLGGLYSLDVPALAALSGNIDLNYPGYNPAISDMVRAREFVSDMGRFVKDGTQPDFTYIWLPSVPGQAGASDADRALGEIVAFLSRTPHWSSTAIFIVPDGTGLATDHVNGQRSFALVVSPLAKPGYVGNAHLSVVSVLKTEEELLGLPPLALNDFLATDMADFFGDVPYPTPYQALP
ncbi:MAG: beta-propeller fold lactonase family protein [Vulcanimicrobiaceae bacterium]